MAAMHTYERKQGGTGMILPQSHRRRRQVMPSILIACAFTWCVGSMTNFFLPSSWTNNDAPRSLSSIITTTTMVNPRQGQLQLEQDQVHQQHNNDNDDSNITTTTADSRSQHAQEDDHDKLDLLDANHLHIDDMFSATWLQPTSLFMKLNISSIKTVEDGCFRVFWPRLQRVRMTYDWLNFSVEHMSKWWKILNVFDENDAIPFHKAVTSFESYCRRSKPLYKNETSPLQQTFAIIPFQAYSDWQNRKSERARTLTVSSLAVTLASLLNVGIGRVVVVGYKDGDKSIVEESLRYLQKTVAIQKTITGSGNNNHGIAAAGWTEVDAPPTMIGSMEVGFARVQKDEVKSEYIQTNIPKGALEILQKAFKGDLDTTRTLELFGSRRVGSYWKYVYLTEPDTILQTKPWVLPHLKVALDKGLILSPHRLLSMPHASDMIGLKNKTLVLPETGSFSTVFELPTDDAVCCDELAKHFYKPWKDYRIDCGTSWWECGFTKVGYNHSHLSPYSLIRLSQGTGIVSLAATEHGRRCIPRANGVCVLPSK